MKQRQQIFPMIAAQPIQTSRAEMLRLIRNEPFAQIVTMTQALGEALLELNTHNRNIRASYVDYLAGMIVRGEWLVTNQGIGVSTTGVLVDGQHRLEAMRQCDWPSLPVLLMLGLSPDAQKAVDLGAKRSKTDILRLFMNTSISNSVVAVLNLLLKERFKWSVMSFSPPQLIEVYHEHERAIELITAVPALARFAAAPFLAAFVAVDHAQKGRREDIEKAALEFVEGANLSRGNPMLTLREYYLRNMKSSSGGDTQKERYLKAKRCVAARVAGESLVKVYA